MSFAGLLIAVVPSLVIVPVEATRPVPRERIGSVLGEPIYRDQIKVGKDSSLLGEVFRLLRPALDRYRAEHRDEIVPTDEEVEFAAAYFLRTKPEMFEEWRRDAREELAALEAKPVLTDPSPEGRRDRELRRRAILNTIEKPAGFFARWMVETRKFERHLYEEFGGGSIQFQQAGIETFDAKPRWLRSLEAKGDFTITDPKLREELYGYWTDPKRHGVGVLTPANHPDAIEDFVNPPWFPRKASEPRR